MDTKVILEDKLLTNTTLVLSKFDDSDVCSIEIKNNEDTLEEATVNFEELKKSIEKLAL